MDEDELARLFAEMQMEQEKLLKAVKEEEEAEQRKKKEEARLKQLLEQGKCFLFYLSSHS